RHPDQAKILLLTLTTGKTAWFWLVFLALGLAATTETALGAIKRLHRPVAASIPVIFGGLFLLTYFTGIVGLVVLREVGIGGLEAKINQIQQIEHEKAAKAQAEREEREQRLREEERRQERLLHEKQERERQRQKAIQEQAERDRQRRLEVEAERQRA